MKKLSVEDSRKLVNSFVKSYGQRGAAQKLTEKGYRSPEGAQILQAHVYRILHGSSTCLLAPEEDQQQKPPTTKEPIAAIPKMQKRIAEELFEDEELLQQEINKTSEELRQELEDERLAIEEMERSMPPLIPSIGNRPHREHRHMERDVRVSAIFNRRADVELEDRDFYGIPRMKHSSPVTTTHYQPRRYGQNTISTTDLHVRQK